MLYSQAINLYLDTTGPLTPARFLTSRSSTTQTQGQPLALVQAAALLVRLFLLKPVDAIGAPADCLTTDGAIIFGIKSNPAESTFLAVTSGFTFVADADLGDHYEAVLDLNTTGIQAELEAAASVDACTEIELQAPGNVRRAPYQGLATISRKIITGSESDPVPASVFNAFIANAQDTMNATVAATAACVTTTANCVTVTDACNIAIGEANTATASALAAADAANAAAANVADVLASITWDGDQLVVNGVTGPHLTGPMGPMGTLAGANGFIQITGSRDLAPTDNGCVLYSTSGTGYTLTLPSTLGSFMCIVVQQSTGQITFAAGAGATVTNEWTYTKTRTTGSHAQIIATAPGVGTTSGSMA